MAKVYRLVRAKYAAPPALLSGEGAALAGGRWNAKGTRVVYASSHLSLAALEALVHAPSLPTDLRVVEIDVPSALARTRWDVSDLPADWRDFPAPAAAQALGTAWLAAGRDLAVWVPSVVVPEEWNLLLNPAHRALARVKAKVLGPFTFDARLRP